MDRRMSEVGVGAVGLFMLLSAAFLFVQPDATAYGHFAAIVVPVILLCAMVLYRRTANFEAMLLNNLIEHAPAELVYSLHNQPQKSISLIDFFTQLRCFTEQQNALLRTQFEGNVQPRNCLTVSQTPELTESESTWRRLRAELVALEDQFYTDMRSDVNSSSNWDDVFR